MQEPGVEKESPINKTIRRLGERVEVLGNEIGSLSERLSAVLVCAAPTETKGEDNPKASSALDERLDAILVGLGDHVIRIQSIKDRLQI